jgi:CRISP-associated protein Cas1
MKKDIYIFNNGTLSRKNDTLLFETDEGKRYIPVTDIDTIHIFGEVNVNKSLLEFISKNEIVLNYYNYYDYYIGSYYPREHLNSGFVILRQCQAYYDKEQRIFLAKAFMHGAMKNMIQVLKYYLRRGAQIDNKITEISKYEKMLDNQETIEQIMALEGNARQIYYSSFNDILKNPKFIFTQRSKRPPRDAINSLISFGNSIIYAITLSQIYQTQLDPRIGYLHSTNERSFSLHLDISEVFKPILVDRTIFSVINKKIITQKDFQNDFGGIILKENARKNFVQELTNKLNTTIQLPNLKHRVSYKRLIRLELYKVQKHLTEGIIYEPFVAKW